MGKMILLAFLLLVAGGTAVFLSVFIDWRPVQEPAGEWFKRSGSILLVFSILSDLILAALFTTFHPGRQTVIIGNDETENLTPVYVFVSILAVIATIAGTVISSYGDLFV